MALNVKLLLKVKQHILAEPRRLVMNSFVIKRSRYTSRYTNDNGRSEVFAACGTAACLAGWTVILGDEDHESVHNIHFRAAELLGLDFSSAANLFYASRWPVHLYLPYYEAETPTARAKIAAKAINAFIAEMRRNNGNKRKASTQDQTTYSR